MVVSLLGVDKKRENARFLFYPNEIVKNCTQIIWVYVLQIVFLDILEVVYGTYLELYGGSVVAYDDAVGVELEYADGPHLGDAALYCMV